MQKNLFLQTNKDSNISSNADLTNSLSETVESAINNHARKFQEMY